MRLTVHRLGRIEHAELDLRPLTVLIGKNGTNKTWTAHAYFKLLERLRVEGSQALASVNDPISSLADSVAAEWQSKMEGAPSGSVSFSVSREELIARLPEPISFQLGKAAWMSTLGAAIPRARVALELTRNEFRTGVGTRLEVTVRRDPLTVERALYLEGEVEPTKSTHYGESIRLDGELRHAVLDLICAWRKRVRALPAERVNLAQIFPVLVRDKDIPMPRALVDFCYMMSIASVAPTEPADPTLTDALAKIAGGRLSFEDRQLVFRPEGVTDLPLPIKASASLVKSIAGLRVFLSTAVRGDAVIIDEPEMCAHPEAQVALTELFAIMVRRGIHVVLATHSPYVVDHLSTLVGASKIVETQRSALKSEFALGLVDAYLRPDELAVYQFEPSGDVRSVFNRESGVVDWSTFTAVSEHESATVNALVEAEVGGDDAP